jgi:hypothetical protein
VIVKVQRVPAMKYCVLQFVVHSKLQTVCVFVVRRYKLVVNRRNGTFTILLGVQGFVACPDKTCDLSSY